MNRRRKQLAFALLAATATIVGAVIAPTPVIAATYKVYSCKTPNGTPAPTDGWSATGHAPFSSFENDCRAGGAMRVLLAGPTQTAGSSYVGWGFDSGGARIVEYSIHRSGTSTATGHGTSGLLFTARQLNDPSGSRVIDYCATYSGCRAVGSPAAGVAPQNRLTQSAAQLPSDTSAWFITVGCGGYAGYPCNPLAGHTTHGSAYVHAAEFTLADDDSPQVHAVAGALSGQGTIAGEARVAFVATDSLSGVHRATIEVDGVERVSLTPNDYGGRCVRLGLSGATNDFTHRRPCPASQPVELSLDSTAIADGTHRVRVRVFDAAGNATTVAGPHSINVANTSGIGPFAAARFESDTGSSLTTTYGRRKTISGRLLTAAGSPMRGAKISVYERVARAGAPRRRAIELTTDELGRFRHRPAATASRSIELVHEPSSASTAISQTVVSRVLLRALRTRVAPFGRMVLRGRIRSERSLRRVTVEIQARDSAGPGARRWRTVGIRRATRSGAFTFAYTFRRTARARLRFRAKVRRTSDLPVDPRASRAVRLRVG